MTDVGYPPSLAAFAGRINDVDAHEWVPANRWPDEFGSLLEPFAEAEVRIMAEMQKTYFKGAATTSSDDIDPESVWKIKGPYAPSAFDMRRRLDVLDFMGVQRQLVFPGNVGMRAVYFLSKPDAVVDFGDIKTDRISYAKSLIRAQNDWAIRQARLSDRIRPVGMLVEDSPDQLISEARRLIDGGIRVLWLPAPVPPGGLSPAHSELDPLWRLCAETDTVITVHAGFADGFFRTTVWNRAEVFSGWRIGEEFSLDPWHFGTLHVPVENFIITMVVGAVFHRHPNLRVGAIESGAHWIGPISRSLDLWSENGQVKRWQEELPEKPSAYIRRNIKVSAFPFEPVDEYIRLYEMPELYCYASDFPHVEGGTDPMGFWAERLQPLGDAAMERFFVSNGAFLLPD